MFLLQAPAPTVRTTVDRILAAHAKMTAFEAKIERPGAPTPLLARSGSTVWLRVPDFSGLFPSTRTYCAKATTGWTYDGLLAEIARAGVKGASVSERLMSIAPASDDAVRLLLEPNTLAGYLRPLATRPGAKLAGSTLTFPAKEGATVVTFDPVTRRITRIAGSTGGTQVAPGKVRAGFDIRYRYGKFGLLGFAPASARTVIQPTVLSKETTFQNAAARNALEKVVRRNARLTRANMTVETDGGSYRVLTANGQIRQIGPRFDLGYNGKTLVIVDRRNRRTYRGTAKRGDVRRVAVKLGEPLLPITTSFLGRSLPFAGVLFPPRRVSVGGSAGANTILNLAARGTKAILFVRPDGLIASLSSEERDQSNRLVSAGRVRFTYETAAGSPGLPTAVGQVQPLPKG